MAHRLLLIRSTNDRALPRLPRSSARPAWEHVIGDTTLKKVDSLSMRLWREEPGPASPQTTRDYHIQLAR